MEYRSTGTPKHEQVSRREFVAGAAMGLVAAAASRPAWAKPINAGGAIDVHSHYFPPALQEVTNKALSTVGSGMIPDSVRNWSPSRLVETMDQVGIRTSVVHATWHPEMLELDQATRRTIARASNDFGARMRQDHPGRVDFFGFVPMPVVEDALPEIAYCFDELKTPGITMMTSYDGRWPGDPAFAPILEELNRRRAVVLVHPHFAKCCSNLMPPYEILTGVIEWPYDTGRAVFSLLVSGSFAKYPDIQWIFCHSGGPIPALAGRIRNLLGIMPRDRLQAIAPQGIDHELQRLYYETANGTSGPTMAALLDYVPPTQVLFGTDYPYLTHESNLRDLEARRLKPSLWKAISHENALRLMPSLRT